jgi:hypothetical protein
MPPHDQVVLEEARVRLGLSSRRWVVARSHVVGNNVMRGALPTTTIKVLPRGVNTLFNTEQLTDATGVACAPNHGE